MKVALYARVSRGDLVLENQIEPLKRRALAENWEYELFTEKESTRKTRPIKEEIIKLLRNKEFDGVCVTSLDRWCRSVSEFAQELEEFERRKIGFYSIREGFSFDSAIGKAMATMAMTFAQLERDLIRQRTLAGLDRARAQGKVLGRPRIHNRRGGVVVRGGLLEQPPNPY
jgi:putative DNA-invertase from lambdoid prophage Rac